MRGVTIMKKELLKGLTEEQIKKVEACKNAEEILALAKAEGVTLSEEQLEAVSGGCRLKNPFDYATDKTLDHVYPNLIKTYCYSCGSHNYTQEYDTYRNNIECSKVNCTCNDCGHTWSVDLFK